MLLTRDLFFHVYNFYDKQANDRLIGKAHSNQYELAEDLVEKAAAGGSGK